jgi:sugar/nucleoside kinase (ribokinase family)
VSLDLSSFEMVNAGRGWLLERFGRVIDVVFANEDEIRALYPDGGDDFEGMARRLARTGVTAAVKLGAAGAIVVEGGDLHRIDPVRVSDVVDTNGAGDAWAAGFLYGRLRGLPVPVSGRIGARLGAETVRHFGPLIPDAAWPQARARVLEGVPA